MAAPDTTNPYAAPSDISSPAFGPSYLWQIDGIGLLVRNGAVLPRIDLESGSEDAALVEATQKFTKGHWSMAFMGIVMPLFQFAPRSFKDWKGLPMWASFVIVFGVWLIAYGIIFYFLSKRFRFTIYRDPTVEARRKRNRNIRAVLYFLAFALMFLPSLLLFTASSRTHYGAIVAAIVVGLIGMVANALWQYYDRPKIHMSLAEDGWLKLGGIHFRAIEKLEAWKATHSGHP